MASSDSEPDSRTLQFGLRDFLFYLVPGGVTLAAVVAFNLESWRTEFASLGIGAGLLVFLSAYFLGQLVYPLTYMLKLVFNLNSVWSHAETVEDAEMLALEEYPRYFGSVVFRDRSFARFSLAMVVPTLLLAIAGGAHAYRLLRGDLTVLFGLVGAAGAGGFLYRYHHYQRRYLNGLERCVKRYEARRAPPNQPQPPPSSAGGQADSKQP